MRVVVFFICLCFSLSPRENGAHAHMQPGDISYAQLQHFDKQGSSTISDQRKSGQLFYTSTQDGEDCCLVNDDWEDDDSNDLFAGKFKSLTRHYSSLDCLSDPCFSSNSSKASLFLSERMSCKYILQRVLRV